MSTFIYYYILLFVDMYELLSYSNSMEVII
uniref:Uncharacterized protein n=1 Tax=Podoviridae sp. ctZ5d16 TaxID=2825257 RepID=A0A8S5QAG6_9CAUD|nr:MAG TPA: hypothetical protein [Podoviridae sp. ctZ5d16]